MREEYAPFLFSGNPVSAAPLRTAGILPANLRANEDNQTGRLEAGATNPAARVSEG